MTDVELVPFTATFHRLRSLFVLRADRDELQQIIGAYFGALRRFPLHAVTAGADVWIGTGTRFPKPAEWIGAMPRRASGSGVPELSPAEAAEHRAAVAQHYEGDPCRCAACQAAGVTHRFLRYSPDEDEDGRDLKGMLDGKAVTRGHWIHGSGLRCWYEARDHFLNLKAKYPPKTMPNLSKMELELARREPTDDEPS